SPDRQFTANIGCYKVKDKSDVIENLIHKVDHLLLGGGLACTFLKAEGHEIGDSLLEEDNVELAASFIQKAKDLGVQLHIQTDAVVADVFKADANVNTVSVDDVQHGWMSLYRGEETR